MFQREGRTVEGEENGTMGNVKRPGQAKQRHGIDGEEQQRRTIPPFDNSSATVNLRYLVNKIKNNVVKRIKGT